ncbi:glycoside hydrolase family 38 C-terminal domain-containing protein [Buttiauxella selenatireducens]|uniref:Glycoside hydrolase family 38 C-terminal domain-containing protein n=1 Tax=Buttiauxella selenatireducens TaxID=3073902 RepID=A0ABY9SBI3_9ENTR|nr:glycoside hydrolase family 38 C-terminal domain-containing protein [Buttiauxella sp. R73]WMY73791.1 glycoside hydrolase family 38 C-terminal domain-containing protein [Buttiauxella sp. R73]
MKTVHLVQHTHWDREWYFTENDSKAVLYYFMDDLLQRLEDDNTLGPFVLDGQTVVIEDYLSVAPQQETRLRQLIEQGRIVIGPWYTQSDFLVVGAESITRNLLLGQADCQRFGDAMPVGYVPDSFGQSAQLPMFLQQFAIDHAVIWRGWSEHNVPFSEFSWQAADGSKVTTAVLPWGYGCAKWLPDSPSACLTALQPILEKQTRFSLTGNVLLPNGNDQSPFEYRVPQLLDQLNQQQDEYRFVRSSFSQFFQSLESTNVTLPIYQGELISPKYMRIHRGIFSTRVDIKQLNARLEQTLSQHLEPLLALNWRLGLPYPQHAVDNIWREAMKSHAHDSIGGCNSDRVNAMVKNRLESGLEMAQQLIDLNMKMLAEGISAQLDGKKIIIFNARPQISAGLVEVTIYTPEQDFRVVDGEGNECRWQIVEEGRQDMSIIVQELSNSTETTWYRKCRLLLEVADIPACGYQTLYLQEGVRAECDQQVESVVKLENPWLLLEANKQGILTLTDKRNQQTYHHVLQLVDGGDAGDNYNYSPPFNDWLINSDDFLTSVTGQQGVLQSSLTLNWQMAVPEDLAARNARRANGELDVTMTITLAHTNTWLDVAISVNNTVRDHRLQVLLPTNVQQHIHFADQPFGLIERQNMPPEMAVWQDEQWTEAPVALYPMQSQVMMYDEKRGLCVLTEGLREYQIPENQQDVMAVTLLRSVGWLGQANMPYRPGRASGMVLPSPDSQIQGMHHFKLSLLAMNNGADSTFWRDVERVRGNLHAWLATGWSRFRTNPHGRVFPPHFSILSWDTELHFSTLKKAQHSDALVVRAWNPTARTLARGSITTNGEVAAATLAETTLQTDRHQESVPTCAPATCVINFGGEKTC